VSNQPESSTSLKAAFHFLPANIAAATNAWQFLQVATPGIVNVAGSLTVRNQSGIARTEPLSFKIGVPEPAVPGNISLSVSSMPVATLNPIGGLPCCTLHTFTANVTSDEKLIGFDFVGGTGIYGVYGPLVQLFPFPLVTSDLDGVSHLVGGIPDYREETHFKILSSKGAVTGVFENNSVMRAAYTFNAANIQNDASNSWPFLQVLTANTYTPNDVSFLGTFTIRNASGADRVELVSWVPEPSTFSAAVFWLCSTFVFSNRRRMKG
jgi:hypothetical protein